MGAELHFELFVFACHSQRTFYFIFLTKQNDDSLYLKLVRSMCLSVKPQLLSVKLWASAWRCTILESTTLPQHPGWQALFLQRLHSCGPFLPPTHRHTFLQLSLVVNAFSSLNHSLPDVHAASYEQLENPPVFPSHGQYTIGNALATCTSANWDWTLSNSSSNLLFNM